MSCDFSWVTECCHADLVSWSLREYKYLLTLHYFVPLALFIIHAGPSGNVFRVTFIRFEYQMPHIILYIIWMINSKFDTHCSTGEKTWLVMSNCCWGRDQRLDGWRSLHTYISLLFPLRASPIRVECLCYGCRWLFLVIVFVY